MPAPVDPADVQAIVRWPYRYQFSRHLLFEAIDPAGSRAFLRRLLPMVTHAAQSLEGSPEPLVNVAVTWPGLVRLGVLDAGLAGAVTAFPNRFSQQPPPAAGEWCGRFSSADVHLDIQLHCRTEAVLDSTSRGIRALAEPALREHTVRDGPEGALSGQALRGGRMHFDVLDGISEPDINWTDAPGGPGTVDLRHVLLGYSTPGIPSHPDVEPWVTLVRNGTYAVLQWIYQDAAALEQYLDAAAPLLAPALPLDEARKLLKAKMLGRWEDGTPLALSPDGPDPAQSRTAFGYADDPQGLRCPLHAHVRLANRRDQPLNPLEAASFPAGGPHLLRRGLPYGEPLVGSVDDGRDRGLVGMFLCADLQRQFFTVLKWINRADFSPVFDPGRSHLQDLMMADRAVFGADLGAVIPVAGSQPDLPPLRQFIQTRGTLLTLMPGLAGLALLARDPA